MEERLTKKISKTIQDKYSLGSYLYYDFANADETNKLLNKLGAFEDFMESLGLEDLEELEHLIGYPLFIDGYDKDGKEINRVEFKIYKESFKEVFEKNKKLYQENQALKDRWEKLKEFMQSEHDWGLENDYQDCSYGIRLILDKMQELEQGETDAKD